MKALKEHKGQIFITSANTDLFQGLIDFEKEENKLFIVEQGSVREG